LLLVDNPWDLGFTYSGIFYRVLIMDSCCPLFYYRAQDDRQDLHRRSDC